MGKYLVKGENDVAADEMDGAGLKNGTPFLQNDLPGDDLDWLDGLRSRDPQAGHGRTYAGVPFYQQGALAEWDSIPSLRRWLLG